MNLSQLHEKNEGIAPTHFISIFPNWLSRDEWEEKSTFKVSDEVVKNRLNQRVNFMKDLSNELPEMVRYDPVLATCGEFSIKRVKEQYSSGSAGDIYMSQSPRISIETGYFKDDADSVWIDSPEAKSFLESLLARHNLFLLNPSLTSQMTQ
jgi:hypothetical protein